MRLKILWIWFKLAWRYRPWYYYSVYEVLHTHYSLVRDGGEVDAEIILSILEKIIDGDYPLPEDFNTYEEYFAELQESEKRENTRKYLLFKLINEKTSI